MFKLNRQYLENGGRYFPNPDQRAYKAAYRLDWSLRPNGLSNRRSPISFGAKRLS